MYFHFLYINGPQHNTPCIFPFNYKGKGYEACTDFEHTQHWCYIKTDTNGNHIDDQWEIAESYVQRLKVSALDILNSVVTRILFRDES